MKKQMTKEQMDFYFSIYYPVLYYSCSDIKSIDFEEFMESDLTLFRLARDHLYNNRMLIDSYIEQVSENTVIDSRSMALLNNMKNARYSDFIVVEKDGLVYYVDYRKKNEIYRICGISQDPIELYQCFPCRAKTAVFDFEGQIVSDGILDIIQKKYPQNAAKAIIRDFEEDMEDKLTDKICS